MKIQEIGKIENNITYTEERVKYVLYARKSTESDEMQALSIDSQVKEMLQIAEREKLHIVEIKRESHSAKASGQRPVFQEILTNIRSGKYTGVLTWAPDRLSRNAGDLGSMVDLMDQKKLIHIQTFTQKFTNDPSQKFLLMILCSQAKLENDNKSINVKRGLRARVEMGLWPCRPPTGYISSKTKSQKAVAEIDIERSKVIREMFEKIGYENWSGMKTFKWLTDEVKFKTEFDKPLSMGNFYRLLENHFYCGIFEFPKKSGQWYKGSHEPIISKELFDLVQENISDNSLQKKDKNKEFAFTKIMTCGLCGSGITADEKFKKLKDGGVNRHVYYKCTKARDKDCKQGFINETDLILQFHDLLDRVDINIMSMKEKISEEVKRFKKFQQMLLKNTVPIMIKDIDIRNYAKFILQEGSIEEKRELLNCFKSGVKLTDKKVDLIF
jgi:site-specific DNA recombinase